MYQQKLIRWNKTSYYRRKYWHTKFLLGHGELLCSYSTILHLTWWYCGWYSSWVTRLTSLVANRFGVAKYTWYSGGRKSIYNSYSILLVHFRYLWTCDCVWEFRIKATIVTILKHCSQRPISIKYSRVDLENRILSIRIVRLFYWCVVLLSYIVESS